MSQYLDKEKLLKWIGRLAEHNKPSLAYFPLDAVLREINAGTFDNYAAHNAVALLDDLEIKLNEANRRIEALEDENNRLRNEIEEDVPLRFRMDANGNFYTDRG